MNYSLCHMTSGDSGVCIRCNNVVNQRVLYSDITGLKPQKLPLKSPLIYITLRLINNNDNYEYTENKVNCNI